jgi:glycosyltransferase involved in cell wall biosynthesis
LPVLLLSIGGNAVQTGPPFANVHLGRVTQPQFLALAYSAADVFVMPTRAEAFGQVVFEAMACGTPVAAFDVGGVPDMVRPGLTGLLAPPEDAVALRRAIETLLRDDALRARMGLACRRVVEEEYGLLVQARRYRALYEALAASPASWG